MLGITTGAGRDRLSRGTSADIPRGAERDTDDTPRGMPHDEPDALTSEVRDRLRYVERQLEAERQAHAEARRLLAAALVRIPAIVAPPGERGSPEALEEAPDRAEKEPRTDAPGLRRAHGGRGGDPGGRRGAETGRGRNTIRLLGPPTASI